MWVDRVGGRAGGKLISGTKLFLDLKQEAGFVRDTLEEQAPEGRLGIYFLQAGLVASVFSS